MAADKALVNNTDASGLISWCFYGFYVSEASWLIAAPVISDRLLIPQIVIVKGKVQFIDAFCGSYVTFAVSKDGHVYGFGLSNYHQLGQCVEDSSTMKD